MTRALLVLLALLLAGCPPQLSRDDDDAADDDDIADDDDAADDDDFADDDDTVVDDDDTTEPVDDDDSVADDDDDDNGPPVLVVSVDICEDIDPISFDIGDWSITGQELEVQVSYGGGCEVHDFHACWDGTFGESWPVQAMLVLQDYGPPDPCDAYLTEIVTFDLTPLSDSWILQYGAPPGEILINVDGGSGSYTF